MAIHDRVLPEETVKDTGPAIKMANEYLKNQLSLIEFDLPSMDDIKTVANRYQRFSFQPSDVCCLTGGAWKKDYREGYFIWGYLKDIDKNDDCNILYTGPGACEEKRDLVKIRPRNNYNRNARNLFMILPVLDFSKCPELFDILTTRTVNGKKEELKIIDFGWYPYNAANNSMQSKLNIAYKKKEIKQTNRKYTFDKTNPRHLREHFSPLDYQVYEWDNQKFIRMNVGFIPKRSLWDLLDFEEPNSTILNDNSKWKPNEKVWISVINRDWEVDRENKKLIARNPFVSGIQFDNYDKTFGPLDYSKSNVKWYIETYLKPQTLQYVDVKNLINTSGPQVLDELYQLARKEKEKQEEEQKEEQQQEVKEEKKEEIKVEPKKEEPPKRDDAKKNEITALLKEIRDYKQYYLGDEDIDKKVKKLYDDYINNLNRLSLSNKRNSKELTLENRDPKSYYQKLVSDYQGILEELKLHSIKVKDCRDMITILIECKKANIDTSIDPICEKINNLNNIILNLDIDRKDKNDLVRDLDDIITKHINLINSYINEYKTNINAKTRTKEELVNELEKDLKPFEDKLNKLNDCYKMIEILSESLKDTVDPNIDSICEGVNKIKTIFFKFIDDEKINNDLNSELNSILNSNINRIRFHIEELKTNNEKNITMEILQSEFAASFRPYLEKIQNIIVNKDIVNSIMEETKAMILHQFKESKIEIAKKYMEQLNGIISVITEIGTKEEIEVLENSININFDVTKDVNVIMEKLKELIGVAYKLQLDIEEKRKKEEEIEELKIDVDVTSILNGNNKKK